MGKCRNWPETQRCKEKSIVRNNSAKSFWFRWYLEVEETMPLSLARQTVYPGGWAAPMTVMPEAPRSACHEQSQRQLPETASPGLRAEPAYCISKMMPGLLN